VLVAKAQRRHAGARTGVGKRTLAGARGRTRAGAPAPTPTPAPSPSPSPEPTATPRLRVSWDEYFMNIARSVATRSTCPRKFVGSVIVRDRTILSTGYNGSIRGTPHCDEVGHMMEDGHCVRTIHAEINAIIQAAKNGTAIAGAAIYVTASPCWNCFKAIANAGINRVVFGEFYRDERIFEVAQRLEIELCDLSGGD
jgi:dCMP deaminase